MPIILIYKDLDRIVNKNLNIRTAKENIMSGNEIKKCWFRKKIYLWYDKKSVLYIQIIKYLKMAVLKIWLLNNGHSSNGYQQSFYVQGVKVKVF